MNKYFRITNWERFQQYKDRDPKWIKVYRDLVDNYEWTHLPDNQKAHLLGLWLLAAKLDNKIPADEKWIGVRIGATSKINLKSLESSGFIELYNSVQDCTEQYETVPREEKRRGDVSSSSEALELAGVVLGKLSRGYNKKLLSKPEHGAPFIQKMFDAGLNSADIIETVDWIVGPNLRREKKFSVESSASLYEKWDRIQASRGTPKLERGF